MYLCKSSNVEIMEANTQVLNYETENILFTELIVFSKHFGKCFCNHWNYCNTTKQIPDGSLQAE